MYCKLHLSKISLTECLLRTCSQTAKPALLLHQPINESPSHERPLIVQTVHRIYSHSLVNQPWGRLNYKIYRLVLLTSRQQRHHPCLICLLGQIRVLVLIFMSRCARSANLAAAKRTSQRNDLHTRTHAHATAQLTVRSVDSSRRRECCVKNVLYLFDI